MEFLEQRRIDDVVERDLAGKLEEELADAERWAKSRFTEEPIAYVLRKPQDDWIDDAVGHLPR